MSIATVRRAPRDPRAFLRDLLPELTLAEVARLSARDVDELTECALEVLIANR